jgi:adenosine deaminase
LGTISDVILTDIFNLPKIDLHRHLEGSIRLSTLMDIVKHEALDLPHDKSSLAKMVQISSEDSWTSSNFLSKFKPLRDIYRSPEIIQRVVREAIHDASSDGICYLELQFTPVALSQARSFDYKDVMDWVTEAAADASHETSLGLGLIPSINRHESTSMAEFVAQLAVDRQDKGIVGLGLAGNEAEFSAQPFEGIFKGAKEAGLKLTIHAGEWSGADTVRHALEEMDADRIGHGIRILEDQNTVSIARERRVIFEVCLSSNLHSGVVQRMQDHPLQTMIQAGLQVTLNTDDPGVSNIRLSDEYRIAIEELGLSITSLKALLFVAVQGAFLPAQEKRELESKLKEEVFSTQGD